MAPKKSIEAERIKPLVRDEERSARYPETRGPSVWPTENIIVTNAMPLAQPPGGRDFRKMFVTDETTVRAAPPNKMADK